VRDVTDKDHVGEGYLSIGGHVTLGIGLIELRNKRDRDYYEYVKQLMQALSSRVDKEIDSMSVEDFIKYLEGGKLSIMLPLLTARDIEKDLDEAVTREEAAMQAA
jgi:hypothetical protein